jgi:hypothetical protein
MRSVILFFAFSFGMFGQALPLQETIHIRIENIPGKVESFLIATPNASLNRKVMGTLEFPGRATFTAIIATNASTQAKAKGLEVQGEEGDLKTVAYLDEDCLKRLETSISSLIKIQQYASEHLKKYSSQNLERPQVRIAYNQVPGSDENTGEKAGIMEVGFYGHEEGFGVYLYISGGRVHPSGQFYFPKATLSDLLKIIQATNAFVASS